MVKTVVDRPTASIGAILRSRSRHVQPNRKFQQTDHRRRCSIHRDAPQPFAGRRGLPAPRPSSPCSDDETDLKAPRGASPPAPCAIPWLLLRERSARASKLPTPARRAGAI